MNVSAASSRTQIRLWQINHFSPSPPFRGVIAELRIALTPYGRGRRPMAARGADGGGASLAPQVQVRHTWARPLFTSRAISAVVSHAARLQNGGGGDRCSGAETSCRRELHLGQFKARRSDLTQHRGCSLIDGSDLTAQKSAKAVAAGPRCITFTYENDLPTDEDRYNFPFN